MQNSYNPTWPGPAHQPLVARRLQLDAPLLERVEQLHPGRRLHALCVNGWSSGRAVNLLLCLTDPSPPPGPCPPARPPTFLMGRARGRCSGGFTFGGHAIAAEEHVHRLLEVPPPVADDQQKRRLVRPAVAAAARRDRLVDGCRSSRRG